jgi:hypothetical protein
MELLTVAQVSKELSISENRVREYCQGGRLGRKVGRQWIITRAELDEFKVKPRRAGRPPRQSEG